ncbi:MAG: DUF1344 domain-containing protein [Parvibaculaceae bacterium]
MRKLILSTLIALPLLTASVLAASDKGTVSYVNAYTGTVQLSDGATYYVPNRVLASKLRRGDVVRIEYDRDGGSRVVRDVERTGRIEGTIITPARDVGVKKNFVNGKSHMCDARPDDPNPCYIGQ